MGRVSKVLAIIFPWFLSMLLGFLVAITGSFISLNCDFLNDLRFGFCRGLPFADRSRCCGGSENIDWHAGRCIQPQVSVDGLDSLSVEWVPWRDPWSFSLMDSLVAVTFYLGVSIACTGLAVFLVSTYCIAAKGSGIPEVKATVSGFDLPQSFSFLCLVIKSLGLSLVVASGLALGKEGPLIHIGVCWAYCFQQVVARPLKDLGFHEEIMPLHELSCIGAAAGVSTAFGAPLGGVLFAVEELGSVRSLTRRTLLYAFVAAFSASFLLKYINLTGANRLTLFALSMSTHNPRKEWVTWEIVPFLLLGSVGGVVGALFIKVNLWVAVRRRKGEASGKLWMFPRLWQSRICWSARTVRVLEGVLNALVTCLLNYPWPLLRTLMTEAIYGMFETCPHWRFVEFQLCDEQSGGQVGFNVSWSAQGLLLLAGFLRLMQTSWTFGAALPSGLFIPSLFVGATVGRVFGNLVYTFNQSYLSTYALHIEPGVFAMVGAIATLSGFCRMTVSLVVIMFELTGEVTLIVPFMCAVLVAKLVGDAVTPSIYDAHGSMNGYAMIEEQDDVRLGTQLVSDIAKPIPEQDLIDGSKLLSSDELQTFTESPRRPIQEDVGGESLDAESTAAGSGLLVVVRPRTHGAEEYIIGVVERSRLQSWKREQACPSRSSFLPLTPRACSLECAGGPGCGSGASMETDLDYLDESEQPVHEAGPVLDASSVVDTDIARLSSDAPLLTAHCVFEQRPALTYCVCHDGRQLHTVKVLSRADFREAIFAARFPLGRPPIHASNSSGANGAITLARRSCACLQSQWWHPLQEDDPSLSAATTPTQLGKTDHEFSQACGSAPRESRNP